MTIDIKEENKEWTLLIVHTPNVDDIEENKTQFYDCLKITFETINRKVFLGDTNARVGNNSLRWNGVIGEQGEETLNNN
jgi:hypothetical protein